MTDSAPRIAIVSGAGRGIGAATARRLAASGHHVAALDIDAEGAKATAHGIEEAGGTALAVTADVADEDAVVAAVHQVADTLGAPSVLINNAGILRDNLLFKMSTGDWDDVMGVHLRGAFHLAREAQRHMTEVGYGRIVNISSIAALGNRGQANYAAAKAGLQGLTKTLAIELGRFGVTVNAIAPGFIETDMTRATATRMRMDFEDFKKLAVQQIPLGRVGQPEDVANLANFLVGDEAAYVTGQVIYVAGGPAD